MPIQWDLLSDTQKSLIEHNKGPMLVFAGPGTGKTEVLTQRIAYLARQGIDPEQIRAITFTKKARNEMIDRLKEFEGLEDVKFNISTLHGFAVQILATYGKLRKYKAANDETAIIFMDAVEDIAGKLERAEYKECIKKLNIFKFLKESIFKLFISEKRKNAFLKSFSSIRIKERFLGIFSISVL